MLVVRIRGVLGLGRAGRCRGLWKLGTVRANLGHALGHFDMVSGNGQVGIVGATAVSPLVVKVTGASNTPIKGASVTFAVTVGAASLSPTTATTDATGQAKSLVTLGSRGGRRDDHGDGRGHEPRHDVRRDRRNDIDFACVHDKRAARRRPPAAFSPAWAGRASAWAAARRVRTTPSSRSTEIPIARRSRHSR